MKYRFLIFCFTLSLFLLSGCPKQSPVQNEPPASPADTSASLPAKPAAPKETSEEKTVRERTEQLGGTIRKNQAGRIIGIVIENNELTVEDMQAIAKLSDLETIRITGPSISDEYVEAMSSLIKLKSVDIFNSNITNQSLEILKTLPEIETLSLQRNVRFTDEAVALFTEFPKLQTLNILYNDFSPTSLMGLGKLSSIRVLDLRALPIGDDTLIFISKLENLEEIHIRSTLVTNAGMEFLKRCKNLKTIELQDTSISTGCAEHFKEMESLRSLRIFRAPEFDAEAVSELGVLTNLETLELRELSCSNEALKALKPLTQLKTVEFSELKGVDAETIMDVLKAYPKLESIRMFAMLVVDDSVAAFLATIPTLKTIGLPVTSVGDNGLEALTALKNLSSLEIFGNKENITLEGATRALTKFKNLRRLIIPETLEDNELNSKILKSSPRCNISVRTYSQEG